MCCPSCGVSFRVQHKYQCAYWIVSLLSAILVAYLQDLESIIFAGAIVLYFVLALSGMEALSFRFKLPLRFQVLEPFITKLDI